MMLHVAIPLFTHTFSENLLVLYSFLVAGGPLEVRGPGSLNSLYPL